MKASKRIEKVRRLLAETGCDAIVVRSITDLMWLTGFERVFDTEEAHTAVITADKCLLHTDMRYSTAMRTRAADEGIWEIDDERCKAAKFVGDALKREGLSAARVIIDADTPLSFYRALTDELPAVTFEERRGDILRLRAVKEPEEIEALKRAQAVADAAFTATLEKAHSGMTEREVSLELEMQMRMHGADELAFANIVASGPNSANPHSVPGDRELQKGDLVVIDFGARVDGYRSDTTRTIAVGEPTEEQRRIYDTVLRANAKIRETIKAGVTGAAMHQLAEDVLAEGGYAGKMGHSLGHGVGLDIHEWPLNSPSYKQELVVGNVVTDEPGIYLSGSDGVRIEDCGVVTEDGYEIFSRLSHDLQVIE